VTTSRAVAGVVDVASRRRETAVSAWVRMLECHSRILTALRSELTADVTLARFDLLTALDRQDGQTLAQLSRGLLVTAGNLTGLVDRAARDGVVVRKSDARDRRVSRVYLTRKGRAMIAQAIPRHTRAVQKTFAPLTPAEQDELRRLLGKLRDGLQARQERA
jgi:DNA-binding MarR family transcriptional regulator